VAGLTGRLTGCIDRRRASLPSDVDSRIAACRDVPVGDAIFRGADELELETERLLLFARPLGPPLLQCPRKELPARRRVAPALWCCRGWDDPARGIDVDRMSGWLRWPAAPSGSAVQRPWPVPGARRDTRAAIARFRHRCASRCRRRGQLRDGRVPDFGCRRLSPRPLRLGILSSQLMRDSNAVCSGSERRCAGGRAEAAIGSRNPYRRRPLAARLGRARRVRS
jgi:hypothetical protein